MSGRRMPSRAANAAAFGGAHAPTPRAISTA
jgi:hypothetical protein